MRPSPYLLRPRSAGPVVHRDLGQAHAHPRRDRGDEAVHLAVEAQAARDLAAHHLERAAVVVQVDAGRPRDQPVREERRDPLRERVPAGCGASRRPCRGRRPRAGPRAPGCRRGRSGDRRPRSRRSSPRERSKPAEKAAVWPKLRRSRTAWTRGSRASSATSSFAACRRVLPSSTRISSNERPVALQGGGELPMKVGEVLRLVVERDDDRDRGACFCVHVAVEYKPRSRCGRPPRSCGPPRRVPQRPAASRYTQLREEEQRAPPPAGPRPGAGAARGRARGAAAAARGRRAPSRRRARPPAWPAGSCARAPARSKANSRPSARVEPQVGHGRPVRPLNTQKTTGSRSRWSTATAIPATTPIAPKIAPSGGRPAGASRKAGVRRRRAEPDAQRSCAARPAAPRKTRPSTTPQQQQRTTSGSSTAPTALP